MRHNPSERNGCFDSTQQQQSPAAAPLCAWHRNRCHDQFCNLSACVRLLFTLVPHGWRLLAPASVNPVCGHVLRGGTAH